MAHTREGTCACCGSEDAVEAAEGMTCYCPLDDVVETVGRKYSMQIVGLLGANGPMRFTELGDALDVTSTSTLSNHLEDLAAEDLVERRSFDESPPRVEYSLTPRGRELEVRLQPLLEWVSEEE